MPHVARAATRSNYNYDEEEDEFEEDTFLLPLNNELPVGTTSTFAFVENDGNNDTTSPNPQDDHEQSAHVSLTASSDEINDSAISEGPKRSDPLETISDIAGPATTVVNNASTHSLRIRKEASVVDEGIHETKSPIRFVRRRPCSMESPTADTNQDSRGKRHSGRLHIFGIPVFCCCSLNRMAAFVLWSTIVSLNVAVVWYSYELFNHGTDPHKIAWFSAGAFVLLGFPVSIWCILGHLMNYNSPGTQVYIVRILWMVPIYSIQSWLAMRFHKQAVFIETLRDFYESYVLYSFTQFLTEVLGGEEALILMLKDKSPTRGVHMWGLQWCVKPWIMGQPVRRYDDNSERSSYVERVTAAMSSSPMVVRKRRSRVHWKSPFLIKCKFGVLQYVLIKLVCAVAVLLLEYKGWYKEGRFLWNAGYLYICIVTNVSQCWALYCLIFFYYATKTELGPIRPVGKFLSVKALVFFTWWQSVFISMLVQMDMIPNYQADERSWSSDDVAKGIQDYLICVEMFVAAVVHTFVFPHSEYSVAAVNARANAIHQKPTVHTKRLGRKRANSFKGGDIDNSLDSKGQVEMVSLDSAGSWEEDEHEILLDGPENRPGLFKAFMDSAIPRDLRDNTYGMMKGEYNVEKKTLLHHATTSDQYDLFSNRRFARSPKKSTESNEEVDVV